MNTINTHPRGKKYDWPKLKAEFLGGEWLTVMQFLTDKGMPAVNFKQVAGWGREKKAIQQKSLQKTTEKLINTGSEDISKVRDRQARMARYLQLKGMTKLQVADVETIEEARKLITVGLREEREALGIGQGGGSKSWTQINILGAKTNLDKIVEKLDYEGLLGLIAELKRFRVGRSGETTVPNSPGKVEDGTVI